MNVPKGGILIISGASGAGKTTLVDYLTRDFPDQYVRSRSTTTRPIRGKEKNGIDYDFVTEEAFDQMVKDGIFLEHAGVHGKHYGTRFELVLEAIRAGKTVVLTIDVQGHQLIRQSDDSRLQDIEITSIFIDVDVAETYRRLVIRGGMSGPEMLARRREAEHENMRKHEFDHVVENPPNEIGIGFENLKRVLGLK